MPQISKVERDHDIKQVSRLEDLKPATEKSVSRATPQIRGKPQINETQQNLQTSVNAARRASIAAIRHAKTISESSDKNEDQEAIDKMEVSARNAAADAAKAIIDLNKFDLYKVYYSGSTTLDPFRSVRNVFLDPWNCEVIWALTTHDQVNVHRHGSPRYYNGYESAAITQSLVDEFQMWDGRDITNSSDTYPYKATGFSSSEFKDAKTGWVFAPSGTYNQWVNREPRFYMNVAFNGSYALYNDQADHYKWQLNFSGNDGKAGSWDFPRSGYVRTKGVSSAYNAKTEATVQIPWVMFRYAEVLLNYAEALNEYDPGNTDIVKYLNLVRARAGLPGVASGLSQAEMRDRIRHERRVELCGERLRYYDTRRWLIAEQTEGGPFYGMNVDGDGNAFYNRVVFENRIFRKEFYLFPIPQSEINKDKNIVQNPGW